MVLVSVQSVEDDNGYSFKNDFAESLIIDPNSKISLINIQFQRKVEYVVLNGGNAFEIKVGDPTANKDIIGIPSGTYDKFTLSITIQNALNQYYLDTGHIFSVLVDKDGKFEISNEYRPAVLVETPIHKWDTLNVDRIGDVKYLHNEFGSLFFGIAANWEGEAYTGVPVGSSVYPQAFGHLLTDFVPNLNRGGSHITFKMFNSPANTQYPIDPVGNGLTNGIIMGLTKSEITATGGSNPTFGVKEITAFGSYASFASGIMLKRTRDAGGTLQPPTLHIIENGLDIGMSLAFTAKPNDEYRILLAGDMNYPMYQFKRANETNFNNINLAGASQGLDRTLWYNSKLSALIGCDNHLNAGPHINVSMTADNSVNVLPIKIAGSSVNNTHTFHEDDDTNQIGTLKRSVVGANPGYNATDGMLFNNCEADSFSEFSFKLDSLAGDFSVAILDENTRITTQEAGAGNGIPVGGALYGNTAQVNQVAGGLTYTASSTIDKNPALFVYRFNAWNGTDAGYDSYSNYDNVAVYKRDNFNAYNSATNIGGRNVPLYKNIDTPIPDWETATDPSFKVRVNGSANMVDLLYASDGITYNLMDRSEILQKRKGGLKDSINGNLNGVVYPSTIQAFPVNSEVFLTENTRDATTQYLNSTLLVKANTDGAGNIITPLIEVLTTGNEEIAPEIAVELHRVNLGLTPPNTTSGIVNIRFTKVDYDFTATTGGVSGIGMGIHFDENKTYQGSRSFAG